MTLGDTLRTARVVLTEGGVVERLRRHPAVHLDPCILHAGLIYDGIGSGILKGIYREYLDAGRQSGLPMLLFTPTWRATRERIAQSGFRIIPTINRDCFRFVDQVRRGFGDYAPEVLIGGLMGSKGDAYKPEEAPDAETARRFHERQAGELAEVRVDFLFGATLPALSEAIGMAAAMAGTGIPYALSFVVRADGTLLDGSHLHDAVHRIDATIQPAPLMYMVNCTHPTTFAQAMQTELKQVSDLHRRVMGLQANASSKSPEELDRLPYVDAGDPQEFAELMVDLPARFGTKILGGCCGTDARHIRRIAELAGKGIL